MPNSQIPNPNSQFPIPNSPLVSIGMPVYNGDRYLRLALDSLLAQDYDNFELIISDNASTDKTSEICREYAARDSRIRYYRNPINLGATKNFNLVFELSAGEYFMWAAHDDLWDKTYVRKCAEKLQKNPNAVLCSSEAKLINEEGNQLVGVKYNRELNTAGLSVRERVRRLIGQINWYESIYGIIRPEALRKTNLLSDRYGSDVIILMELMLLGEFAKVTEPLFSYRLRLEQDHEEGVEKPYTNLAKNLLEAVRESSLEASLKREVAADVVEVLSFNNIEWRNVIINENLIAFSSEPRPELMREAIENAIAHQPTIKILYDISVLGLAHHYHRSRTGVFRVVENIARGLLATPEIELSFCATESSTAYKYCQDYIKVNPDFQKITLYPSRFPDVDIFHSPYYTFPRRESVKAPRLFTVYDLIPILHPEFFAHNQSRELRATLEQIKPDDWVICISHSTKNDLCNCTDLPGDRVFVTHLAADPNVFYPCSEGASQKVRHKYGIPPEPYLLSVCTLEPRKNIDLAIRCFAQLVIQQGIEDLNLVLVGTKGWKENKIFAEIERNAFLKNRIIVTGYVADEDLAALYSGALAFVYPSFYEGFGLPPLEAMQCGVPVITSNTSSLPEVVGDAGIMLDPRDADGLCQSMLGIYQNPSLREEMSRKSLAQAKKFTWEKCLQETIALYKNALDNSQKSQGQPVGAKHSGKEEGKKNSLESQKNLTDASPLPTEKKKMIIIDGVFFQINNTGIARVWTCLLQEWVRTGFAKQILMLDRSGTAPRIAGVKYLGVRSYDYNNTDGDRAYLQQICDEEKADIFISTYYTTPISTPSVFMAYDMIPELQQVNLADPMWREKHYGIRHASGYIAISESTARDLVRYFPGIAPESVAIAYCGIQSHFQPAAAVEIEQFKSKYGIAKPYFILVGDRLGVNNYKNTPLFFQALAQLKNSGNSSDNFEIICVGGRPTLEPALTGYVAEAAVRILKLSDIELRAAYSGAVSLVYPSKYEGFGLPVVEAMACGCPVITCPNGAISEAAGEAALYINDSDVAGMAKALVEVQKPETRDRLIAAGLQQAKKFSWSQMAEIVSAKLQNLQPKPQTPNPTPQTPNPTPQTPNPTPHTLSLSSIPNLARQFRENNGNREILAQLRQARKLLAEFWLRVLSEELPDTYAGEAGEAHRSLLESGLKDELLTESDREFLAQLASGLSRVWAERTAIQTFLAATLYARCYELPLQYQGAPIPKWLFADYVKFLLAPPSYFRELGQAEKYYNYYQGLIAYISSRIASNPDSEIWQDVAWLFSQNASFLPLYFAPGSLREVYTQRSQIMEFALKSRGHQLDFSFPARTPVAGKKQKIRLGVLKAHWNPQTETFATIPVFEHLDREQFEIILYAVNVTGSPLEQYCQQKGDRLVKLPSNLSKQVQTIRFDDLDILWIGTNVTAISNQITFLALHRLARVQVTSLASPVSTGMSNIDCYIAGSLTAPASASEQYREQLKTIEGSGLCFSYPLGFETPTVLPDRSSWGASEDTTVFVSGANFFKIIPELRETWAKIMVAVPNSILVLYPFGPAWTRSYPAIPFVELLKQEFAKHGIDINRLLIIKTLPTSADIKECLKLGDVYLDSYPYGGATSLLDPLEVGLPTVAFEGDTLRFRQAIALLRELGITDLIADSEEAYLNLAIELGTNRDRRNALRKQILQKMQQLPPFLDRPAYGAKIGNLFKELVGESQQGAGSKGAEEQQEGQAGRLSYGGQGNIETSPPPVPGSLIPLSPVGQASRLSQAIASDPEPPVGQANAASQLITEEFLNRLVGCANLYYIDPSDESIIAELRVLRRQLADFWLGLAPEQVQSFYQGDVGKAHKSVIESGFLDQSLNAEEQSFSDALVAQISSAGNVTAINGFVAVGLYRASQSLQAKDMPDWLN
ncbi:MAG: glycosyltransferase [Oscillatoria sp. SIO1A7]|nr:glycosyltransferase [Oscillatoria sp. SIO1A7]